MILEALTKMFDDDDLRDVKAWRALAMLVALMEAHGESYGYDGWEESYKEIHLALLDALREEYRE